MENLEQQAQIINLGKLLVNELGLDPGTDTLSKWMAHYVADKMTMAEQMPTGQDKRIAEKECFEAILKLWEHRWSLPPGKRPLKEFESILKTLEKINPDNRESTFFYQFMDHEMGDLQELNPTSKEIADYIALASEIDRAARIWIDYIFKQAALKAKNHIVVGLLENAVELRGNEDVRIIQKVLDNDPSINFENYEEGDVQKKYRIEKLKKRIEDLERFTEINAKILESYKNDLESLIY